MRRADWVKCVAHTHELYKTTSWCGRREVLSEFHFVDIDHALYNNLNKGRLVICEQCLNKIELALHTKDGWEAIK